MNETMFGLGMYLIALLTSAGIYAVLCLGLNLQWGVTGLFNAGIAGFFAVGAYTSAILTSKKADYHLGGYDLPVPVGLLSSMIVAGIIAYIIGRICLRLKSDYLAMATIGVAEVLRLILRNELWLSGGGRGISGIPKPFDSFAQPWDQILYLVIILVIIAVLYFLLERGIHSPWGRIMRAIRENEISVEATGKNVEKLRLQSFVLGSMIMGLGGALTAHTFKFVGPDISQPLMTTFLVWVMLIVGGSGNNVGAILGALSIWTVWSATEFLTSGLSIENAIRLSYLRVFFIGLILQIILQFKGDGLFQERRITIKNTDDSPKKQDELVNEENLKQNKSPQY